MYSKKRYKTTAVDAGPVVTQPVCWTEALGGCGFIDGFPTRKANSCSSVARSQPGAAVPAVPAVPEVPGVPGVPGQTLLREFGTLTTETYEVGPLQPTRFDICRENVDIW